MAFCLIAYLLPNLISLPPPPSLHLLFPSSDIRMVTALHIDLESFVSRRLLMDFSLILHMVNPPVYLEDIVQGPFLSGSFLSTPK